VAAFRLRRRGILWSLLVAFLVGLGMVLDSWLSPQPRCVISFPKGVSIDFLSDDGGTILTGSGEASQTWETWDTSSGQNQGTYLLEGPGVHAISPCGRFLAVLEEKGNLHLVDLKLGKQSKTVLSFSGGSPKLLFSSQGTYLLAVPSQNDGEIILNRIPQFPWDRIRFGDLVECSTGRLVKTLRDLTFFRFLSDESVLFRIAPAGPGMEGIFTHWNPRTGKSIRQMKDMVPIDLSPDGRTLLAVSAEHRLYLLDLWTQKSWPLDPPHLFSFTLVVSPDGKTLVTFADSEIFFWDVASGKKRGGEKWTDNHPGKVLFSPDSAFCLLACDGPEGYVLRETASGRSLWKRVSQGDGPWVHLPAVETLFSADGQFLFVPTKVGYEILEVKTGETTRTIPVEPPHTFGPLIKFTRDARFLLVREDIEGGLNQKPGFWQKLLGDWWAGASKVTDVKVKVFEPTSGRILAQLQGQYGQYGNHLLSNDGRTMVTAHRASDGSLSLHCWDLPLRPPLRLVIGIPLGIGLFFVLMSWWRGRRRAARLKTSSSTG
jgi:WD40 repeat protein